MGRQGNVRVDVDLIAKLKQLVRKKENRLRLKEYRSVSQAAEAAIKKFLLEESDSVEMPAQ